MKLPSKEESNKILNDHVDDDYQKLHAKMVALALEAYAKKFNEDELLWYVTGLLHDLDYYEYPNEHPGKAIEWFKKWGYSEELIHAVEAHAYKHNSYNDDAKLQGKSHPEGIDRRHNGFSKEPETKLAACLIACDELSGLIYAYSLMNPKGIQEAKVKSIKKKMKDKSFASKINRDDIKYGVEKANLDMTEHIEFLLNVFKEKL